MKFLFMRASELISGLSEIKSIYFYLCTTGKRLPGYTSDLLVVDFKNGTRKLYRYSITREHFEYVGMSSRFIPVWMSKKKF